MADISNLYPQPPAAPTNALAVPMTPQQAVGLAGSVAQLRAFQADQAAKQATGEAYQGALGDDGSLDVDKLAQSLRSNPAAAYGLPENVTRMLQQRGAQLEVDAKHNQFLVDSLGSLADDPNLTLDKVRNVAVTQARNLKIPGSMLNGWLYDLPKDKKQLRAKLVQMRNLAIGSTNLSTPTDTGVDETGAQTMASRGSFNYRAGNGGMAKGLAPGEAGLSESAAGRAAALQATASSSPQYHADLENLRQDSAIMGNLGGPPQH